MPPDHFSTSRDDRFGRDYSYRTKRERRMESEYFSEDLDAEATEHSGLEDLEARENNPEQEGAE